MVRYRSREAFSPDPRDWKTSGYWTDTTRPSQGWIDAAFSPDGNPLAVVANADDAARFELYLTNADDRLLAKGKPIGVQACKVVWRPDGEQVVVVQNTDCGENNTVTGDLVRLPANDPSKQTQLNASGDNPVFQPLTLGG